MTIKTVTWHQPRSSRSNSFVARLGNVDVGGVHLDEWRSVGDWIATCHLPGVKHRPGEPNVIDWAPTMKAAQQCVEQAVQQWLSDAGLQPAPAANQE